MMLLNNPFEKKTCQILPYRRYLILVFISITTLYSCGNTVDIGFYSYEQVLKKGFKPHLGNEKVLFKYFEEKGEHDYGQFYIFSDSYDFDHSLVILTDIPDTSYASNWAKENGFISISSNKLTKIGSDAYINVFLNEEGDTLLSEYHLEAKSISFFLGRKAH